MLESVTYANGGTVKAKYDLAGNLISETDPEHGNRTCMTDPARTWTASANKIPVRQLAGKKQKLLKITGSNTGSTVLCIM